MYKRLFEQESFGRQVSAVWLGCGNMVDYWSLAKIIMASKIKCRVRYTGVDMIARYYKIEPRNIDNVEFKQGDIVEFLKSETSPSPDIYFFPKSISEIEPFENLCGCMADTWFQGAQKDKFHVLISLRSDEGSFDRDLSKVKEFISVIESGGFVLRGGCDIYEYPCDGKSAAVTHYDNSFSYPSKDREIRKKFV